MRSRFMTATGWWRAAMRPFFAGVGLMLIGLTTSAPVFSNAEREIVEYELVGVTAAGPGVFEYTYRARLTNRGAALPNGATATLRSRESSTTIVDGLLEFGPVGARQSVTSRDTFSVRHPRRVPFGHRWPTLVWAIVPIPNRPPVADAGLDAAVAGVGVSVRLDGRASSDPDGDPLRHAWSLTGPVGSSASLSSPTEAVPSFVADVRGTYEARLIVDDGRLASAPDTMLISVGNTAPVADAGADVASAVARTVALDGASSHDADGDPLTFAWTLVTRPANSAAVLMGSSAPAPSLRLDTPGTYVVRLIVNDGLVSGVADTVTIVTVNTPPLANAGADRTTPVGTPIALDGGASADADGDALVFAWTLRSRPEGSAAQIAPASAVTPTLIADTAGTYEADLVVFDGQDYSLADTVAVSTVNSAPVARAGADQTAFVGTPVALSGSASSDVDGDALTFTWSLVARPAGSTATLRGETTLTPSFALDLPGAYQVQLVVNDGLLDSQPDVVDIQTRNSPPVANAGGDRSVYVTHSVTLDGSASTDVDGNTLAYFWALTTIPAGSHARLSDPSLVTPAFVVDVPGLYIAQLIVDDGTVQSVADTTAITTINSTPVAHAGADIAILAGQRAGLDGTMSSDVDGDWLAFEWALIVKPLGSSASIDDPYAASTSMLADRPGTYVLQLIVRDGTAASQPDTVTISTTNAAPVADAGRDQSGASVRSTVILDGFESSDADRHALAYRWSLLSLPPGSSTALSDATSVAPYFYADRGGLYVAQLIVNDGFVDSAPDTIAIDISNRAPMANAGFDRTARTGTVLSLDGAASSDPDGEPVTYQWAFTGRPAGSAAVLTAPSSVMPWFTLDMPGVYTVGLTVADATGATSTDTVEVTATVPIVVTLRASDAVADETGSNPAVFTFTRSGATTHSLTVRYTVAGSAANGIDYTAELSGTVTIAAGQLTAVVAVVPVDDTTTEGVETIILSLAADPAYLVGTPAAGTATLSDNDQPFVTVVATDAAASEVGPDTGTFTVTRTGGTSDSLRVTFALFGNAAAGGDYVGFGSSVVIPAGQVSTTIAVTPIVDALLEGAETVGVSLTSAVGSLYVVGTPYFATVTITNAP
jgi:hypothetical protein